MPCRRKHCTHWHLFLTQNYVTFAVWVQCLYWYVDQTAAWNTLFRGVSRLWSPCSLGFGKLCEYALGHMCTYGYVILSQNFLAFFLFLFFFFILVLSGFFCYFLSSPSFYPLFDAYVCLYTHIYTSSQVLSTPIPRSNVCIHTMYVYIHISSLLLSNISIFLPKNQDFLVVSLVSWSVCLSMFLPLISASFWKSFFRSLPLFLSAYMAHQPWCQAGILISTLILGPTYPSFHVCIYVC